VRWSNEVYGPFRTEIRAQQAGRAPWFVDLRTSRTDQTVFKLPAADLEADAKFGSQVRLDLEATITYEDRDPTSNVLTHVCRYSTLLGAGFRRLPAMGYPLLSVETDRELLLRYAKRFTSRKNVQLLRELLAAVDPVLDSQLMWPRTQKSRSSSQSGAGQARSTTNFLPSHALWFRLA
jgi:hypothetical protein